MHARTIANLIPILLLGGGLCARQQAQDPVAAEMTALLLEQVKGDAVAAEAELQKALAQAQAKDRPRLLLRRVLLLERLGRAAEADAALKQLAQEPAPLGPWAAARLGRPTAPAAPIDPSAPILRLVASLDHDDSHTMVSQANAQLHKLGPLAVPALLGQLDKLGIFGLRRALGLLTAYPDMGVVPAFERLLSDPDPVRQLTAAQALVCLPLAVRKPLAIRILENSQGTWLRLAALGAVAEDPAERGRLAAECARKGIAGDAGAERRLTELLGQFPLPGNQEVVRLLEAMAMGDNRDAANGALCALPCNLGDDGEDFVLALLERLPKDGRDGALYAGVKARTGQVWKRARVRELKQIDHDPRGAIAALQADGIEPLPQDLAWVLEGTPNAEVLSYVLNALTALRDKSGVAAAVRRVPTTDDSYHLIRYLATVAPEELDQRIGPLIARTPHQHVLAPLLRLARERGLTAAVGPALERLVQGSVHNPDDVLELVARHSGPEHLAQVLELSTNRYPSHYATAASRAIARWFNPTCVAPSLVRLGTLGNEARMAVARKVREVATPADVPAIRAALEQLRSEPGDWWAPYSLLIEALGRIGGPTAVAVLEGLTLEDNSTIQAGAWEALREIPGFDRKAALAALLNRKEAVRLLPRLLNEPLVAQDETLRRNAIARLRESSLAEGEELQAFFVRLPAADRVALATEVLDALDQGPESMGRLAGPALQALGSLRDEALIPLMARCLKHRDSGMRHFAITQIGGTFSLKALPWLLEAMKDEVQENADLASKYLDRIGQFLERKKQIEAALSRPDR